MSGALDIAAACEHYDLSRDQLLQLRKNCQFPAIRIGHKVLIPIAQADQWFADHVGQTVHPLTGEVA